MRAAVGVRVVIAEHDEYDGDDDEGVVFRTLLGARTFFEVRWGASAQGRDHPALRGQDAHPDICGHDGAEHRAELQVSAASAEIMAGYIGRPHDERIGDEHAEKVAAAKFPEQ